MKRLVVYILVIYYVATTSGWRRRRRRRCDTTSCLWTWNSCSRRCGGGLQSPRITRQRGACGSCNLPSPRRCNTHCCAVNCNWAAWGSWGSCSVNCGSGIAYRHRGYSQRASCGGRGCSGSSVDSRSCNTGCCPVNCRWGSWGNYGGCSRSCGRGQKTRSRSVTIASSCGGARCSGSSSETVACNTQCCPVNCVWGSWGHYSSCSTTCGGGVMSRNRHVSIAPLCGGASCPGSALENARCNTSPCPINCRWSSWSNWGGCTQSCGGGSQVRSRRIDVSPRYGGNECVGSSSNSRVCNSVCCPVHCVWDDWSEWEECSQTCGRGVQSRARNIRTPNACGGNICPGEGNEERYCNDVCCPVNCRLSLWTQWERCSSSCGGGNQSRTRNVIQNASCGGEECERQRSETRNCNTQCCPVDCHLDEWGYWGSCTTTCGADGTSTRNRSVAIPPQCGGEECNGVRVESKPCNRLCFNEGSLTGATCECASGWSGICCEEDVNECVRSEHDCHTEAACANTAGSYTCTCLEGYTGNGTTCRNIDECTLSTHNCDEHAECEDVQGSYTCMCSSGYNGNGFECENINECITQEHSCDTNAECYDTQGNYTCNCMIGYSGDGFVCNDVNECDSNTSNTCHNNAECINTEGSYTCVCSSGYSGNGTRCSNIDECNESTHNCNENAMCVDTDGEYSCTCVSGFSGDGFDCENMDECVLENHDCDTHARCSDTNGSYICSCLDGYIGNGFECADANECTTPQNDCDEHATCTNLIGSYRCQCNLGYTGNGKNCSNFNECELGTHRCDTNAMCLDIEGNYICECEDGYTGNGFSCQDVDECESDPCGNNMKCSNNPGSFNCLCLEGFVKGNSTEGSGSGITPMTSCRDLNECFENDACHEKAECVNVLGSFNCICSAGFSGDGVSKCADVDECADPDVCGKKGICQNVPGYYYCICDEGYVEKKGHCENVDECAMNTHRCHESAICIDQNGGYTCTCLDGFAGNGTSCIPNAKLIPQDDAITNNVQSYNWKPAAAGGFGALLVVLSVLLIVKIFRKRKKSKQLNLWINNDYKSNPGFTPDDVIKNGDL